MNKGLGHAAVPEPVRGSAQPAGTLLGGTQDNGTLGLHRLRARGSWGSGGDGGASGIDAVDPQHRVPQLLPLYFERHELPRHRPARLAVDGRSDVRCRRRRGRQLLPADDRRIRWSAAGRSSPAWTTSGARTTTAETRRSSRPTATRRSSARATSSSAGTAVTGRSSARTGWTAPTYGSDKLPDEPADNYIVRLTRAPSDESTMWAGTPARPRVHHAERRRVRSGRRDLLPHRHVEPARAVRQRDLRRSRQPVPRVSSRTRATTPTRTPPGRPTATSSRSWSTRAAAPGRPARRRGRTSTTTSATSRCSTSRATTARPGSTSRPTGACSAAERPRTWMPAGTGLPPVAVYGLTLRSRREQAASSARPPTAAAPTGSRSRTRAASRKRLTCGGAACRGGPSAILRGVPERCAWARAGRSPLPRVPRRGVGRAVARPAPPVRDARARGRAGGSVVVDDPAQARGLPAGVRRLRPGARRRGSTSSGSSPTRASSATG